MDATVERHGRVDGLVNNAGASFHGPLEDIDLTEYGRLLELNVVSVLAAIQAVLPVMRRQHTGRIVSLPRRIGPTAPIRRRQTSSVRSPASAG